MRHATIGDYATPEGMTLTAHNVRTATDNLASEIVALRGRPGTEAAQQALRQVNAALSHLVVYSVLFHGFCSKEWSKEF